MLLKLARYQLPNRGTENGLIWDRARAFVA